ncbi:hypothetical protein ACLKA6_018801 [Drosophila palustris]
MEEEKIIVISDEEMAEPPLEAYVEDCESSEAGEEGADTDTTEPLSESRSDHADRDPRRRRPHYGERSHHGSTGTHCTEARTLCIEVPQARNHPSYVEEPVSPPPFPTLPTPPRPQSRRPREWNTRFPCPRRPGEGNTWFERR